MRTPLWQSLEWPETAPSASVSASPLIQQAALSQMKEPAAADVARPANGGSRPADDDGHSYAAIHQTTLRLKSVATRLEELIGRLVELTMWLSRAARIDVTQTRIEEQVRTRPAKPRFEPRNGTVTLTIADVPSLQNLMRVGLALSDLTVVADASIAGLEHGSAVLHLTLLESLSLSELMQGMRDATTLQLLVEESRPEASRLRLRFVAPKPQAEILRMPAPPPIGEAAEAPSKPEQARTKARKRSRAAATKRATKRPSAPRE